MKLLSTINPGVIFGQENNSSLFIRKTVFEVGYTEKDFHNHPNSYEFYLVIKGILRFATETEEISATEGDIVFFEENEPHKINEVKEQAFLLLIKKIGAVKG